MRPLVDEEEADFAAGVGQGAKDHRSAGSGVPAGATYDRVHRASGGGCAGGGSDEGRCVDGVAVALKAMLELRL